MPMPWISFSRHPSTNVAIGSDGYLRAGGRTIGARYALADGSLDLNGTKVASDTSLAKTLCRIGVACL